MNANNIKARLLNNIKIPTIDMFYFLEIFKIEISKKVTSAAISLEDKPTLFINEDFVNRNCKTDEHLLMLVMHELYHFILGHTSLVKRSSEVDNIVFDAIINAHLCKMFIDEEYTSFFTKINPSNEFPACLLHEPNENTLPQYEQVLYTLYHTNLPTYEELYELFKGKINKNYVLLGNHGDINPLSPFSKSIVKNMNGRQAIYDFASENGFDELESYVNIKNRTLNKEKYAKICSFINKITREANQSSELGLVKKEIEVTRKTFIPSLKDRYITVKDSFFENNLLYKTNGKMSMYTHDTLKQVLVYLDVSGSMFEELEYILPVIQKLKELNMVDVYQFSNKVYPFNLIDIKHRKINTTNGTDINAPLKHYFETNSNIKNILFVTDGCIPEIKQKYKTLLKKRNVNVYAIVTDYNTEELDTITTNKIYI